MSLYSASDIFLVFSGSTIFDIFKNLEGIPPKNFKTFNIFYLIQKLLALLKLNPPLGSFSCIIFIAVNAAACAYAVVFKY